MPQGIQAIAALFILLPGFISARVARSLSHPSQQSELERVIEALILSFVLYLLYILVFGTALPIEWKAGASSPFAVHRWRVALLALAAIALGAAWGKLRSTDRIYRVLRRAHMTTLTNGETVWNNVFYSLKGTVQVGLGDGRVVRGWLQRYSDTRDEHSLFLAQAAWIPESGEPVDIPGPGILITGKAEIQYVMFLDDRTAAPLRKELS